MLASLMFAMTLAGADAPAETHDHTCQGPLQGEFRLLRSEDSVDLCELSANKVTLVVNTASQCGFTGQFEGLEALYQSYREQGFQVVGFPSDSFNQEYGNEEQTADVCYINYGVTFPMMATSKVRGGDANPVFADLIAQTGEAPRWNFYKYLVNRDGDVLGVYPSTTPPDDQRLRRDIERAL
ncbi:glutathione peroxidase [Aliidiomarina maris]|uniref:Glutathione peroxidase n=1 Tax=Aliidiomarina maris TaxID=531312 RepID=A0A327WUF4_9GAMM|nr:glutathione peroxidase [Aliidiomarina maris]MBA3988116.1 glutathione peroxidase [Idiomarina sp.]RAJ96502.1 glutathione peroxidase [Aliidiomarina maris]RUO23750.1 glutathione peroxidase [Aliidiomarina maris]